MCDGVKPAIVDSVHDRAGFVLHSFHRQTVQLLKRRCDVFTWLQLTDEASGGVLDSLQDVDCRCW